jgi:hypothetical protein
LKEANVSRTTPLAVLLTLLPLAGLGEANSNAVILQGWSPEEAAQLDWAPDGVDTLDELWNDCFLTFEMFCARPGIDTAPGRIHMLWGKGADFRRDGDRRYDPARLGLVSITDDSACIATVESVFGKLAGTIHCVAPSSLTASGWELRPYRRRS